MKISYTTENIKSLTRLSVFEGSTAELFRFLLKSKRVVTDKLSSGYYTRCVINGARNNENAADEADMLVVDCDSQIDTTTGEIIAGAVAPFEPHLVLNHLGIDHLITSSHSNTADVRKYRIVIPCHYTRQQLPALLDWLFERFHENEVMLADVKENRSWAQAWFFPSTHPERQHLFKTFWRVGGTASNPLRDDTEIEFLPAQPFDVEAIYNGWMSKKNSSVNPSITTLTQHKPIAVMSANPIEAFNANFSIHDVLIRNGYKQQGKRYLHPNSASKIAGVRILERGAFSDSNDALNDGRCHDAFDCFRLLECGGDMKAALNWNSDITRANQRAFFDVPKTEKPPQHYINGGFKKLVESPSVRSFRPSNSQISTDATV